MNDLSPTPHFVVEPLVDVVIVKRGTASLLIT